MADQATENPPTRDEITQALRGGLRQALERGLVAAQAAIEEVQKAEAIAKGEVEDMARCGECKALLAVDKSGRIKGHKPADAQGESKDCPGSNRFGKVNGGPEAPESKSGDGAQQDDAKVVKNEDTEMAMGEKLNKASIARAMKTYDTAIKATSKTPAPAPAPAAKPLVKTSIARAMKTYDTSIKKPVPAPAAKKPIPAAKMEKAGLPPTAGCNHSPDNYICENCGQNCTGDVNEIWSDPTCHDPHCPLHGRKGGHSPDAYTCASCGAHCTGPANEISSDPKCQDPNCPLHGKGGGKAPAQKMEKAGPPPIPPAATKTPTASPEGLPLAGNKIPPRVPGSRPGGGIPAKLPGMTRAPGAPVSLVPQAPVTMPKGLGAGPRVPGMGKAEPKAQTPGDKAAVAGANKQLGGFKSVASSPTKMPGGQMAKADPSAPAPQAVQAPIHQRIPQLMQRLSGQHAQAFATQLAETGGEPQAHALCDRFERFAAPAQAQHKPLVLDPAMKSESAGKKSPMRKTESCAKCAGPMTKSHKCP